MEKNELVYWAHVEIALGLVFLVLFLLYVFMFVY